MLNNLNSNVSKLDEKAMRAAKEHWDHIGKPIEGLGLLEDMVIKIAGMQGKENVDIEKKAIVIMCSDNGVVEEWVTQTNQEVTAIVTENFGKGIASVNAMAVTGCQNCGRSFVSETPITVTVGQHYGMDSVDKYGGRRADTAPRAFRGCGASGAKDCQMP